MTPAVTVVVPARDDERWIDHCITSIAAQDYPADRLQVIVVVDAASRDATDAEAKNALGAAGLRDHEVVRNDAGGGTPAALNLGLARAVGDYFVHVDARSRIPRDYVRRCVDVLEQRPEVVAVGGAPVAIAQSHDPRARGIARALNNRWALGTAPHPRGPRGGPSDTVFLGCFRTADLRAVGGWDPELPTSEDVDLHRRLAARGEAWVVPDLPVWYVPRRDLGSLYRQHRRFGEWDLRYWRRTGERPRPRQLALLVGGPAVVGATAAALVRAHGSRRAGLLTAVAGGAALVELRGSRSPEGGSAVHGWSFLALGAVAFGWLTGVVRAVLGRADR